MTKLYSDLKMFHYQEKLDSLPQDKPILPPLHIRLKPTNACNHKCRYCSYRDPAQQLGSGMNLADSIPREKMLELAHDIADMGVKAVTFSGGGEPMVYPHLLEASKIMVDGGVKLASLTNGALLQGEKAEFFAHNATWVRISMDGWDDASYTRYRGVADGEFTKIMRNISEFSKLGGDCVLGVSYIVDNENYSHIRPMLERLKDAGVRSVKVSACIVSNDSNECNAYHAAHFEATQETVLKAMEELNSDSFEIVNAWHNLPDCFDKEYNWCPYIQLKMVIAADMGIYPCQDKAYVPEYCLGKIDRLPFNAVWTNIKSEIFKIKPCAMCNHHCTVNEKNKILMQYLNINQKHSMFV